MLERWRRPVAASRGDRPSETRFLKLC